MVNILLTIFLTISCSIFLLPIGLVNAQALWSLEYKTALVAQSAFSPNSSKVVTANRTGKLQVWSTKDGRLLKTSTQQNKLGYDNPIDWSSDGKYILTPGVLWHSRSLKIAKRYGYNGIACAFSNDGTLFAAYVSPSAQSRRMQLNIYKTSSFSLVKTLYSTNNSTDYYPSTLQFTKDGRFLLVGLQNKARGIQVWNIQKSIQVKYLKTPMDVTDLQLSPNQKTLAIGTLNTNKSDRVGKGSIILYSFPSLQKHYEFDQLKGHVTALDFHPSSNYLVSSQHHSRPTFHLWDIKHRKLLKRYNRVKRNTNFAQFSPNGQLLAIVSQTYGDMGNPINFDLYDVDQLIHNQSVSGSKTKFRSNRFRKGQKVRVLHDDRWYTGSINRKGNHSYLIKMDRSQPKYWLWVKPKNIRPIKRIIKRLTK